ncbi:NUDIX hydrolase [Paracoccus sp. MC1862]|uniref:NUDIX hydrolase n=1 Tax=Paracoccus sp. MC1862 TaxID=2760307 RepID=UPI0015FFE59E|nr:NUDIX hydrolase [Paracoccus sp. MC1862]MBB1498747.1 NUDIX hydrolase [Paracoccus sp. MC1862]QQO43908.1 NUDIX hydrolase [Paracoccus sp. MC1862]
MKDLRRRLARFLGARTPRLQAGAICRDPATGKVLLITSRDTGRWIIPKGWPMPGRTLAQAALQEAWEEAGVHAHAAEDLGIYHYDKTHDRGFAIPVEVRVFLVPVEALADCWPEQPQRTRRWFAPEKAAGLVSEAELAALLSTLAPRRPAAPFSTRA